MNTFISEFDFPKLFLAIGVCFLIGIAVGWVFAVAHTVYWWFKKK